MPPKPPRLPARHLSSIKPQLRLDPLRIIREKEAHHKAKQRQEAEADERTLLNMISEQKALADAEARAAAKAAPPEAEAEVEAEVEEILGEEVSEEEVLGNLGEEPEAAPSVEETPVEEEALAQLPPPPAEVIAAPEITTGKTEADLPALLSGTNTEIAAALETGVWDSLLEAALAAEKAGKNRKGAKDTIQARIASLG